MTAGTLLRVFVDEMERYGGKPAYMAIVDELLARGFGGATVLKAIDGFGPHGETHSLRAFDTLTGLPVLIEAMETDERVAAFLPRLREILHEGLITLERVQLLPARAEKR